MIQVTDSIALAEAEIGFTFIHASGPGGQNVNKLATAAQLRFDVRGSRSLPPDVAARLERLAGSRLTIEGVIVITGRRFRSQDRNRADALARLVALIVRAAQPPALRRRTRPPAASRAKRLEAKARRSTAKRQRARPAEEE
jgi:ribosome-associated protein